MLGGLHPSVTRNEPNDACPMISIWALNGFRSVKHPAGGRSILNAATVSSTARQCQDLCGLPDAQSFGAFVSGQMWPLPLTARVPIVPVRPDPGGRGRGVAFLMSTVARAGTQRASIWQPSTSMASPRRSTHMSSRATSPTRSKHCTARCGSTRACASNERWCACPMAACSPTYPATQVMPAAEDPIHDAALDDGSNGRVASSLTKIPERAGPPVPSCGRASTSLTSMSRWSSSR